MKKTLLTVLTLLTAVSVHFTVPASEESEPAGFYWPGEEVLLEETGLTGRFVFFDEFGYKVWIPDIYEEAELSREDESQGILGRFITNLQENGAAGIVSVGWINSEARTTEGYIKELKELDYDLVEPAVLNGEDAVSYFLADQVDGWVQETIAVHVGDGCFFEVSSGPCADDYFKDLGYIILSSVQPVDGAVEDSSDQDDGEDQESGEDFLDAEEASGESTVITWEEIVAEEDAAELLASGDFYSLEDSGWKMWVPKALKPNELTEDDLDNGYVGYFTTGDQSAVISVVRSEIEAEDIEGVKALLAEDEDVSGITDLTINGVPFVSYMQEDQETACLTVVEKDGIATTFTFRPSSDDDFMSLVLVMAASIQQE